MGQATTSGRDGAVEVRPFPAETKPRASEAEGLSGEAVKGNPTTTVIPRVDESKSSHRATEDLTEPPLTLSCPVTKSVLVIGLTYKTARLSLTHHSRLYLFPTV